MINNAKKKKIIEQITPHTVIPEGVTVDIYWDNYFKNFYEPIKIYEDGESFFTYKQGNDHIWAQDFVCGDLKSSYRVMEKLEEMSKKQTVKMHVSVSNVKMLNILLERGFKIKELIGYNYLIERNK